MTTREIHVHHWARRTDERGHTIYACRCGAAVDFDAVREAHERDRPETRDERAVVA